ncbi:hypothetical protein [Chondrinema litorale]|uniref:hypothetical protein n=1 Tax=Chondrinema litorale TaxID=2994555 RepID=UPI0025436EDE|nr:hypothetical protein [Chondrinema litorale]UZS00153.1 hypothetical protein OQ292_40300 [Chondrinema litorale]
MNYINQEIDIVEESQVIHKEISIKPKSKVKSSSRNAIMIVSTICIIVLWIFSSLIRGGLFFTEAVFSSFILGSLLLIKIRCDPKSINQK